MSVPEIDERDPLYGIGWYWEAFHDLHTMRSFGSRLAGPIPWQAIQTYAETHQLDVTETYILHRVISYMDKVFRDWAQKNDGTTKS